MTNVAPLVARIRSSSLVRSGILVFLSLTGANLLNYAFYAIVGRLVGVVSYGAFSSLVAAVIICMTPAIIGQTVVAKLAADFHAVDDDAGLRGFAKSVTTFSIALGGILSLAGIALARPLGDFLHIADPLMIGLASLALGAGIVMWLQRGIFQGAGAFGIFGISNLVEALGKTVFAAVFVAYYGVRGAFIGLTLGLMAAVIYNGTRLAQRFGTVSRPFRADAYRIFVSASATGLGVLAITTMLLFDVILVKHYFGAREAGLYGAAGLIGRALYTVVAFVPTIVLPKARSHLAALRSPLPLLVGAGGVTVGFCAAALVVFRVAPGEVVSVIAGRSFLDAAPLIFPYGCATAALATANVFAMYKIGIHRFDFVPALLLIMCAEIGSVVVRHRSLTDVLQTIIVGHTIALCVVLWRLPLSVRSARRATLTEAQQ